MMTFLLAITPLLLILVLMLVLRKPLVIAAPITYIGTLLLVFFVWQIQTSVALGATMRGFLLAVSIMLIIFGAIFFLNILKDSGVIHSLERYLGKISPDKRVQVILLIWFMGSFLEGTAGFGTPAAVIAPILVGIGVPAIVAVSVALVGNSIAVVFGAAGTPILIGLAGLDITHVPWYASLFAASVGLFIPLMILVLLVWSMEQKNRWQRIIEAVPFALWAGVCLVMFYPLFALMGPEFPSILAPIVGGLVCVVTTKLGFFVPKYHWKSVKVNKGTELPALQVIFPYALLVVFLFSMKYITGSIRFILPGSLHFDFNLANPGISLVLAGLVYYAVYQIRPSIARDATFKALRVMVIPFIAILFITGFVQLLIYSDVNSSGLPSMVAIMAGVIDTPYLPLYAAAIGATGSFITGSGTVSTILFGNFQSLAATSQGFSVAIILGLQLLGAAVGNMVALSNIVAAQAAVQMYGKEYEILKRVALPFLATLLISAIVGALAVGLWWS